jgi:hypothetical protein
VQRRNLAETFHLRDREIADADGTNFSLIIQRAHRLGGLLNGYERIGPMDLVDVDVVGAQPTQRLIDLLHDPVARRVAVNLAVTPLQTHFGGNNGF